MPSKLQTVLYVLCWADWIACKQTNNLCKILYDDGNHTRHANKFHIIKLTKSANFRLTKEETKGTIIYMNTF